MAKNILTAKTLCQSSKAAPLYYFVENVFNLAFEDKPDYEYLRKLLEKVLTERDILFSAEYDWNEMDKDLSNCSLPY